jgi:hypothetical protein
VKDSIGGGFIFGKIKVKKIFGQRSPSPTIKPQTWHNSSIVRYLRRSTGNDKPQQGDVQVARLQRLRTVPVARSTPYL